MTLKVELVAADRKVWSGDAARVVATTTDGDIGILTGHAPLLGVLVSGEIRIAGEGADVVATVDGGGFLSVDHDVVTIIAETASVGAEHSR